MEAINMIFEDFAVELIVPFFSNGWETFLMLKQVIFSFIVSIPKPDPTGASWESVLQGVSNFHSNGGNLKDLNLVEFIQTLTQIGPDIIIDNTATVPILKNLSNGTI